MAIGPSDTESPTAARAAQQHANTITSPATDHTTTKNQNEKSFVNGSQTSAENVQTAPVTCHARLIIVVVALNDVDSSLMNKITKR